MPNKEHDPYAVLIKKLNSGEPDLTGLTEEQKELEKDIKRPITIISKKAPGANVTDDFDIESYNKYLGAGKFNLEDMDFLNRERARRQGSGEQFIKTLGNTLSNSITGIARDVGYLGSLISETGNERDYTNSLVEWSESLRNPFGEVYRANPNEFFDLGDSAWWFNNGGSLVESLVQFGIEGAVTGGILGTLGKAGSTFVRGISQGGELMNAVNRGSKLARMTQKSLSIGARALESRIPQIGTSAFLSSMESSMEAASTYKKIYDKYKNLVPDETAKQMAAEGATATFRLGATVNTLLNLTSVAPLFKDVRAVRKMRDLGIKSVKGESMETAKKRIAALGLESEPVKKFISGKNALVHTGLESFQEGVEEVVTQWSGLAGIRLGEKSKDKKLTGWEYLAEATEFVSDIWNEEGALNFILGAVGGAGNKFVMERVVRKKTYKIDDSGNRVGILNKGGEKTGEYEKEWTTEYKRNKEARKRLFLKNKNTVIKEFDYIEEKQNKLKEIVEKGEEAAGATYEQTAAELFDLRKYQMITTGSSDILANSFDEISKLDNTILLEDELQKRIVDFNNQKNNIQSKAKEERRELTESESDSIKEIEKNIIDLNKKIKKVEGKTEAMQKGYAEKINSDDYEDPFKKKALKAKEDVLKASVIYDNLLKDFEYGEYERYEVPNAILDIYLEKETSLNSLTDYIKKYEKKKDKLAGGLNETGKQILEVELLKESKRIKENILESINKNKDKNKSDLITAQKIKEDINKLDIEISEKELVTEPAPFDLSSTELDVFGSIKGELSALKNRKKEAINLINGIVNKSLDSNESIETIINQISSEFLQVGKDKNITRFTNLLEEQINERKIRKKRKGSKRVQEKRIKNLVKSLDLENSLLEIIRTKKHEADANYEVILTREGKEEYIKRRKKQEKELEKQTIAEKKKKEESKKKIEKEIKEKSAEKTSTEQTNKRNKEYQDKKESEVNDTLTEEDKSFLTKLNIIETYIIKNKETDVFIISRDVGIDYKTVIKAMNILEDKGIVSKNKNTEDWSYVEVEKEKSKQKTNKDSVDVFIKQADDIRKETENFPDEIKKYFYTLAKRIEAEQEDGLYSWVINLSPVIAETANKGLDAVKKAIDIEVTKINNSIFKNNPLPFVDETSISILKDFMDSVNTADTSAESLSSDIGKNTDESLKTREEEAIIFDKVFRLLTKYIQLEGIYDNDIVKEHNNLVFSIRDKLQEAGELGEAVGNKNQAKNTLSKLLPYINAYFNQRSAILNSKGFDAQEVSFSSYSIDDNSNLVNNTSDRLLEEQKKFEMFFNPKIVLRSEFESPLQKRKKVNAITIANKGTDFDVIIGKQLETATKATPIESKNVKEGDPIRLEVNPDYDGNIGIYKNGKYVEINWKEAQGEFGDNPEWLIEHTPIAVYKGNELLGFVHDLSWVNDFNIAHETDALKNNVEEQRVNLLELRKNLIVIKNGKVQETFHDGVISYKEGGVLNRDIENKYTPIKSKGETDERIPNIDTLNIPMLIVQTDGTLSNSEISDFNTGIESRLQKAAGHVVLLFHKEGAKKMAFVQPSFVDGTYKGETIGDDFSETVYQMMMSILKKETRLSDTVKESGRNALKGFVYTVPHNEFIKRKRGTKNSIMSVTRGGLIQLGNQIESLEINSPDFLEKNKSKVIKLISKLRHNADLKKLGNKDARAVLFKDGEFINAGNYDSFLHSRFLTDVVEKTYIDSKGNKESVFINNPVTGFEVNLKFNKRNEDTRRKKSSDGKDSNKTVMEKRREQERKNIVFSLSSDVVPSMNPNLKIKIDENNETRKKCKGK